MANSLGRRRWLVVGGGLFASAAFLALAVRGLTFSEIFDAVGSASLWPWAPLAVGSYMLGHLVRGERCRLLFGPEAPLSLATASNIVVVGYAANNVLPARLGEFVRAAMLSERTGVPYSQALTVTFVERLLDGIAILFLLVLGALFVPVEGWVLGLIEFASVVFGVALIGLLVAVLVPGLVFSVAARLTRPWPGLSPRVLSLVTRITNAAGYLRDPGNALKVVLLSVLVWCLEVGLFAFMLRAFDLDLGFSGSSLAMGVTNLGILVPSTPGFVGTFHGFCSKALTSEGVTPVLALSAAFLIHLGFYIPVTLWGVLALLWYGVQVGSTLALAREVQHGATAVEVDGVTVHLLGSVEVERRRQDVTPFMRALTEALVTLADPVDDHERRIDSSARFLVGQLGALPARYRMLAATALFGFGVLAWLGNGRRFQRLPLARRQRIVRFWAFGPVHLFRSFFRVLRSPLMIAYYDAGAGEVLRDAVSRSPNAVAPERRLAMMGAKDS